MKKDLLEKVLNELNWKTGYKYYFKVINGDYYEYDIEGNTFSMQKECSGEEHFICIGTVKNLVEIEKGIYGEY